MSAGIPPAPAGASEALPAAARDVAPLLLVPAVALAALALVGSVLRVGHAHRRGARDGDDDLHHGERPHARVRADGRAEFRPRRLRDGGRLRRDAGARPAGRLDERRLAGRQPRGRRRSRSRSRWRSPRSRAGSSNASSCAPVYGQHLRQILVTMGGAIVTEQAARGDLGPGADPAAPAAGPARRDRARRRRHREVPPARGLRRPRRLRGHVPGPQPHADRPAHPCRGGERADGRGARLPHPAPVRGRVHGGLGARGPGGRSLGPVPRDPNGVDGRRDRGDGVHRRHHRRAGLGRRLLHRRASSRRSWPTTPASCCRSSRSPPTSSSWSRSCCGAPPASTRWRGAEGPMLRTLLSDDPPRSRLLAAILVAIFVGPRDRPVRRGRRPGAQYRGHDLRLHRAGGLLRPPARLRRHRLVRARHVLRHRRLRRGARSRLDGAHLVGRVRGPRDRAAALAAGLARDRARLAAGPRRSSSR